VGEVTRICLVNYGWIFIGGFRERFGLDLGVTFRIRFSFQCHLRLNIELDSRKGSRVSRWKWFKNASGSRLLPIWVCIFVIDIVAVVVAADVATVVIVVVATVVIVVAAVATV